jgi:hypothetical protein
VASSGRADRFPGLSRKAETLRGTPFSRRRPSALKVESRRGCAANDSWRVEPRFSSTTSRPKSSSAARALCAEQRLLATVRRASSDVARGSLSRCSSVNMQHAPSHVKTSRPFGRRDASAALARRRIEPRRGFSRCAGSRDVPAALATASMGSAMPAELQRASAVQPT